MSGGTFDYFQRHYQWEEIKEKLKEAIDKNPEGYGHFTLLWFAQALHEIEKARVYIDETDLLFAGDTSEHTLDENLKKRLKEVNVEYPSIKAYSAITLHDFNGEVIGTVLLTEGTFEEVCDLWDSYLNQCLESGVEPEIWDFVKGHGKGVCQVLDFEFY